MQLVVIGAHQRTAPMAVRERLAFPPDSLPAALRALRDEVSEGFIVSTCNRVEVYGLLGGAEPSLGLKRFLAAWHGIAAEELTPHLYTYVGADAVRHVFRLAAGLDSMVLGEAQILQQLKLALSAAQDADALGPVLQRLLYGALGAGKLVRTETGLARNALSVVSVGLERARQTLGGLRGRRCLVVGAGRTGELALKHLQGEGVAQLAIVNRTRERARALAEHFAAAAYSLADLPRAVRAADVVICCTAAPGILIDVELAARASVNRTSPLVLLDLAVPRDVDRQVAGLPNVRLFDVDDLRAICEVNRTARAAEVASAEALVEGEVGKFLEWWASQAVVPTVRALRDRAEAIRQGELERTLARLPDLTPREQQAIIALSSAIVNKLLHAPITSLKAPEAGPELAEAVQQLFKLEA